MKIMITMILSASFIAASNGIVAENGLMKAIDKVDNSPKPLISVTTLKRPLPVNHIRELHGDFPQKRLIEKAQLRQYRLAKFKATLKKQQLSRQLNKSKNRFTMAY